MKRLTRKQRLKKNRDQRRRYRMNAFEFNKHRAELIKTDPEYRAKVKHWRAIGFQRHKKERIKISMAYLKKHYAKCPSYKLASACTARIWQALKDQRALRLYSYRELIGCSWKDLQHYLEKQFKPGMTWRRNTHQDKHRFKAWHMHHLRPVSSFDLAVGSQQLRAFHYTNIRPTFVHDHIRISARYLGKLETRVRRYRKMNREYKKALSRYI